MVDSMFTSNIFIPNEDDPTNSHRFNRNTELAKEKNVASFSNPVNDSKPAGDKIVVNKNTNPNVDRTAKIGKGQSGTEQTATYNIANAFDMSESAMRSIMNGSNIYSPEQIHDMRFSRFARYGMLDMSNEHSGSREYIFFTKPDLHIFETDNFAINHELGDVTFFKNAVYQYPLSMLSLQQTLSKSASYPAGFNADSLYIPLLSNHVTSSFDLPGIAATETENNISLYQVKTTYRDSSEVSDFGFEFSLEFWDTRYIDVYMFFKAYDEYCREEFYRNVTPPKLSYITDKVNCKQFSIFKIIVDETNTIIFYAKATGVCPMGVPRDAMSNFENTIKITVPFKAQFVRDMDPIILSELNHITERSAGKSGTDMSFLGLYDKNNNTANTTWGAYPYIIKRGKRRGSNDEKEGDLYRLVWVSP